VAVRGTDHVENPRATLRILQRRPPVRGRPVPLRLGYHPARTAFRPPSVSCMAICSLA